MYDSDPDALIYAAVAGHDLGRRVRSLFPVEPDACDRAGIGSVHLVPELLTKPLREHAAGADRFLTDNRSDLPKSIAEIDVIYPPQTNPGDPQNGYAGGLVWPAQDALHTRD